MTVSSQTQTNGRKSLFVMVGDVSADRHTSKLIAKLNEVAPELQIWGIGGPDMAKQNFEALRDCRDFTVVGIIEVVQQLPFFVKLRHELIEQVTNRRPDAVLLCDFGGFNLFLAQGLRKRFPDLPILYFISPQVWGSRPWRMNTIKKTVTKMLVIFPFEEALYHSRGINASFVGHPLTENLPSVESLGGRDQFCQSVGINTDKHLVGIFPGSRRSEVRTLMPVVLQAMQILLHMRKDVQYVIAAADPKIRENVKAAIARTIAGGETDNPIQVVDGDKNYELMANADFIWSKSGTTALEVTMYARPMIAFYRAMWVSYCLFVAFKGVKRVAWPNLLAGEKLVPELIQLDCRAELLVRYTNDLLDVPALRQEVSERLAGLRSRLGHGQYTSNCAAEILKAVDHKSPFEQKTQAIF
jgi:lipid-A-disaccharide synthase